MINNKKLLIGIGLFFTVLISLSVLLIRPPHASLETKSANWIDNIQSTHYETEEADFAD